MAENDLHRFYSFESDAVEKDTFKVVRFRGEEAISRPFHFEIDLASEDPDLDLDKMLLWPASLMLIRKPQKLKKPIRM